MYKIKEQVIADYDKLLIVMFVLFEICNHKG